MIDVPLLQVQGLGRRFGGVVAVSDVSFDIRAGEILGLMGANGAGKTTLFAMLAGNVAPSAGHILLDGVRIDGKRPDQISHLGVARTFQIVRPFTDMTVLDNVAIGFMFGRRRLPTRRAARHEAAKLVAEIGLAERAHLPAGALTLAGRKRLEIARAMATAPRLLLLDEVLAGLNATEVADALAMLAKLQAAHGFALIIIEHVMRALMRMSQRILVLHDGRKIMEGSPQQVAADPRVIRAYLGEAHAAGTA